MSTLEQGYFTEEDITHVLASLANNTNVASSENDNSSDKYLDYQVQYSIKTGPSGVSSNGIIRFFAVAALDDTGRTYPSDLSGGVPLGPPMEANANATTYTSNVMSVKKAFNGELPKYFKIVVRNETGAALDSTEANHNKRGQGIKKLNTA